MALEQWLLTGPKIIDADNIFTVKATLIGGQFNVVTHESDGVRLEVHDVTGRELRVAIDGNTLIIDHPRLSWDNFIETFKSWTDKSTANITVYLPAKTEVSFGSVSGEMLISGVSAAVRASTVSGSIVLDNVHGDADVNSVSGEVTIHGHEGSIQARSVSGDVSASGAIESFSADVVSADTFLDLEQPTTGVVKAKLVSGNFSMRAPHEHPLTITVNSIFGTAQLGAERVRSQFGQKIQRTFGDAGAARTTVDVKNVHGDVTLLFREANDRSATQVIGATSDAPTAGDH